MADPDRPSRRSEPRQDPTTGWLGSASGRGRRHLRRDEGRGDLREGSRAGSAGRLRDDRPGAPWGRPPISRSADAGRRRDPSPHPRPDPHRTRVPPRPRENTPTLSGEGVEDDRRLPDTQPHPPRARVPAEVRPGDGRRSVHQPTRRRDQRRRHSRLGADGLLPDTDETLLSR